MANWHGGLVPSAGRGEMSTKLRLLDSIISAFGMVPSCCQSSFNSFPKHARNEKDEHTDNGE